MPLFNNSTLYAANGHARTSSLFCETASVSGTALFTLGRQKDNGYISLRDLFVTYTENDPSEVTFAEEVFGDVFFWENLKEWPTLAPHLEQWRLAAEAKRKSKAFQKVLEKVKEGDLQASKYIIDEPWRKGIKERTRSRRSTQVARDAWDEDMERLKEQGFINNGN